MSKFEVLVSKVTAVENHPNADRLNLITVRGFQLISGKLEDGSSRYKVGDLVVYVPENAIVPEYLLRQGFWNESQNKGMLAGSNGDRVKAIKLRGILSLGIVFPVKDGVDIAMPGDHYITNAGGSTLLVSEHNDVAEFLGIVKYEPEIPASMNGEVYNLGTEHMIKFDVENYKKYAEAFHEAMAAGNAEQNRDVVLTEKLHGTCMGMGIKLGLNMDHPELVNDWFVFSKGLGAQGLVFKPNEQNANNIYLRSALENNLAEKLMNDEHVKIWLKAGCTVYLFGEVYGRGVQDLSYNTTKPQFAAFDLAVKNRFGENNWINYELRKTILDRVGVNHVPVLYVGPFDEQVLKDQTTGKTTAGSGVHIREGVVMVPYRNREHPAIGRVILKSVSEDYLTRKGNTTEYN